MLFNSFEYLIFLPLVFIIYWLVIGKNFRLQNLFLLICSYVFYSWWDWRFLFLLVFSTLLDYFSGIRIHKARTQFLAKSWLIISIIFNLGFLGFFKYYNFFIDNISAALQQAGFQSSFWTLSIILPVGISFYTFHGLSYVIDIYKKRIEPERNFVTYSLFVSYFPLLVAGPIERATHLLPQLKQERRFDYHNSVDGLRQILWGLFKKVVIADNCAYYANMIFDGHDQYNGSTLFLGAVFFTFQIYGDFSGYSDIALGTSKLFGIRLLRNFNYPYFSRDIAEFWRRWHISLSSWFRDYVYVPLGGSKGSTFMKIRNTFIIFLLSGIWHGANWTFVCWGLLNAIYFMPLLLLGKHRSNIEIVAAGKFLPTIKELLQIAITFLLTVFAWIFFRSTTVGDAFHIINEIFTSFAAAPAFFPLTPIFLIGCFVLIEWLGREREFAIQDMSFGARALRWGFYIFVSFLVFFYSGAEQAFIYFQF